MLRQILQHAAPPDAAIPFGGNSLRIAAERLLLSHLATPAVRYSSRLTFNLYRLVLIGSPRLTSLYTSESARRAIVPWGKERPDA